jgi:maltose alpha-D-glucosyltransferase/alpha-amylase
MQWDDGEHAGFSNTQSDALYAPLIRDPQYGFQSVNVAAQQADEASLLHAVRKMIAARKELPLLAKGKLDWLLDTPKETICFVRSEGNQRLFALHNISAEQLIVQFAEWEAVRDYFDADAEIGEYITLEPYNYRWLVTK